MLKYMSLSKLSTSGSGRGIGYFSNVRKMGFNVYNFLKNLSIWMKHEADWIRLNTRIWQSKQVDCFARMQGGKKNGKAGNTTVFLTQKTHRRSKKKRQT